MITENSHSDTGAVMMGYSVCFLHGHTLQPCKKCESIREAVKKKVKLCIFVG